MKKYLPILLVILVFADSSCVSKRLTKRGLKYEEAGMFELAAQSYLGALQANPNNIDARIGLKKNGQRLLDEKSLAVYKAYDNGDDKGVVYNYLNAKSWQDQVNALSVDIAMSERTTEYYSDSKPKYLEKIYSDAQLLLDDEKFKQAEVIFAEIKSIDPEYGNTSELLKVSKSEPVYRQGKEYLTTGYYRKAYSAFDQILNQQGTYKDSKELREEALAKGLIVIAMNRIENRSGRNNINLLVESKIRTSLNNLNNPFIKVVDNQNADQIIKEQQRGLEQGADIEIGKILTPKALFTGTIINFDITEGRLTKTEKTGYLKEEIITKDPKTGEEKKDYKYHKVTYYEYKQQNRVFGAFSYKLSSTETAEVMVSDAMDYTASDDIHYATFDGNSNKLVPGYWEDIKKDSPKDKINDSDADRDALRRLLKADRTIKSIDMLQNEVVNDIALRVATKINKYNPEVK